MKNLITFLFGIVLITFQFSCDTENDLTPMNGEDQVYLEELLIDQITAASNIKAVGTIDLPSTIKNYVHDNHLPFEIDMVFHAERYGYEVFLENGLCLYFDENNDHLNHNDLHNDQGNHHGGWDSGINFCMAGDTLSGSNLPQAVNDYIDMHHASTNAVMVVVKPSGKIGVEISTGDILIFSPNGDFINECVSQEASGHGHEHGSLVSYGWHCDPEDSMMMGDHGDHGGMGDLSGPNEPSWGGTGMSLDTLPTAISDYVGINHQDASIFHAVQTYSGYYFLRLSDCARLVFDENGDILFDSVGQY